MLISKAKEDVFSPPSNLSIQLSISRIVQKVYNDFCEAS